MLSVAITSGATGMVAAFVAMYMGYSVDTQYIALLLGFMLGFLISTSVEVVEIDEDEIGGQN